MSNDDLSRREALSGGVSALAVGVGAALAVSAIPRDAAAQNASDAAKLNTLLSAEYDAIVTYSAAIGYLAMPDMSDTQRSIAPVVSAVATAIRADHEAHSARLATLIMSLGGTPVSRGSVISPRLPTGFTLTVNNILKVGANKEKAAAIAYMETLKTISTTTAAELTAAIGGVEAMHFVLLHMAAKGALLPQTMMGAMLTELAPRAFVSLPSDATAAPSTFASLTDFPFMP